MSNNRKISILSIAFFIAAFGLLYWKSIYEMVYDWNNDANYSHGFLIPFVSGYLIWQKKDELKATVLTPSTSGFIVIIFGLGIYFIGNIAGELFTMKLSMLVVLAGAILFVCGTRFFRSILFPFSYLLFMIPLPYILYDTIAFPLKLFVTRVSVDFLAAIGVLVLREGNIIHLADTTLEVADACSGIRSIISLLALSTLLAYMTQKGWVTKVVLVILAVPVAIFVNSLRVIGTGILADMYGSKVAESFFHEFAGFVIFGVAIAILILSTIILTKTGKKH